MKTYIILILALVLSSAIYSQNEEEFESFDLKPLTKTSAPILDDIYLLSKSTEKGFELRWAPTNVATWQSGIDYGYKVERLKAPSNSSFESEPITSQVIKPWPLNDWQTIVNDDNPYCAIAAMAIYGEDKNVEPGLYNQAEAVKNKLGFNLLAADLDLKAAKASGLYLLNEKTASENEIYIYRVYTINEMTGTSSDTAYVYAIHDGNDKLEAPSFADTIEQKNAITLRWYNQLGKKKYTAYHVERSSDGKTFNRITDQPYLNAVTNVREDNGLIQYTDSVTQVNTKYYYRVVGIDAFAEESPASRVISASAKGEVSISAPQNIEVLQSGDQELVVTWDKPIAQEANMLAGYKVYKSNDPNEAFKPLKDKLIPANKRSVVDPSPDLRETNYYYIAGVDKEGNEVESSIAFGIIQDSIAPQAPSKLKYDISSSGKLLIEWEAPKDDDIRGYLVHYSNSYKGPYTVIPGPHLPNTHFVDSLSLNTLTESRYYYVIAVDYSYNTSDISEILEVQKPDLIPPSPSVFKDYELEQGLIKINWIASKSRDVKTIQLHRKAKGENWEEMEDFNPTLPSYIDKKIKEGTVYEYLLTTIDDAENESTSPTNLRVQAKKTFFLAPVENFKAAKKNNAVELSWSDSKSYSAIKIYKSIGDEEPKYIKKLNGSSFIDKDVSTDNNYRYAVVAIGQDGRESELKNFKAITID